MRRIVHVAWLINLQRESVRRRAAANVLDEHGAKVAGARRHTWQNLLPQLGLREQEVGVIAEHPQLGSPQPLIVKILADRGEGRGLAERVQLRPLWERWMASWQASPSAVRWWEAGWMLEEWRLSLFAPGQPREGKVSAKRIEKMLDERDA